MCGIVSHRVTSGSLRRAVEFLCAKDADLENVVSQFGHPPLWARYPGFATLVRIILEQQVSLASARMAYARLQAAAGRITPRRILALRTSGLGKAGLTRQKSTYCVNLATRIVEGTLNLRDMAIKDEAVIRESLLNVSGIGRWTVDIFLLMALRRPDVWPVGDLALAKSVQQVKQLRDLPTAQDQLRIAATSSSMCSSTLLQTIRSKLPSAAASYVDGSKSSRLVAVADRRSSRSVSRTRTTHIGSRSIP